jgi:hypothetical protein
MSVDSIAPREKLGDAQDAALITRCLDRHEQLVCRVRVRRRRMQQIHRPWAAAMTFRMNGHSNLSVPPCFGLGFSSVSGLPEVFFLS